MLKVLLLVIVAAHAQPSLEINSSSGIVASVTIHKHWWTFEPRDDITAPELSRALQALFPALACHHVFGCDVSDAIAKLPPEVKRHFVEHNE